MPTKITVKSYCAGGDASLTFMYVLLLQGGSIIELWGVWDRRWTAALVRVWLLSAGGWSCMSWERREALDLCMYVREGGRKTGSVWVRNPHCSYMFAALEVIIDRSKLMEKRKPKLLHSYISQGGRFSFDLDLSVHSSHAERFKGMVLLWLASAGWGQDLAERKGVLWLKRHTHSSWQGSLSTKVRSEAVQIVQTDIKNVEKKITLLSRSLPTRSITNM